MSYADRWRIGRQEVEIRRPWAGEAGGHAAWIRREMDHLTAAAKKATDAADLVASGDAPPDHAERAEARFYEQKDSLEGWVIGQLLVGAPAPEDNEPPANYGRRAMAWLRSSGWSPGEGEALYQTCMAAIAETRRQIVPRPTEVQKIVDFGRPPEAIPTS